MTKEAKRIIESYEPHKGFFDLSEKPKSLTVEEYAKVLKLQLLLVDQNESREYLKKYNPTQWESAKELSGKLQGIIFEHWGDKVLI